MKIAINGLSAKTGGGVTYLRNLIPRLAGLGKENEYYIIIPRGPNKLGVKCPDQGNVRLIEMQVPNIVTRILKEQILLPFILWEHRVETLYCPANVAPLLAPCRVVLLIQSINPYMPIRRRSLYQRTRLWILRILSRISAKKARKVLFLSDYSRKLVSEKLKIDPTKALTIYLGVDIQQFSDEQSHEVREILPFDFDKIGRYILAISNIAEHKNYEVLINAYAKLNVTLFKQYKLIIIGKTIQSDYYDILLEMVAERGVSERVKFLGEVKHSALPQVYKRSSLFVLPSLVENFSFTLLEAMASGVPVIAADSTAMPEEVGDAGLLFDPNDPDDLCAKMETLLSNPKLREEFIRKGLERAKLFSWEKCAKETLAVFKELQKSTVR